MLDIHSHILYGVDDGSTSIEESLELLKKAQSEGTSTIIATPHKDPHYQPSKELILDRVHELNRISQENGLLIHVLPGQEVRLYDKIVDDYKNNQLITLNDAGRHLLVEFPSSHVPKYATRLFYELQLAGVQPILVHPERNSEIISNPQLLFDIVATGVLTQITAGSIMGKFGRKSKKLSHLFMTHNVVTFIASDAHHIKTRDFHMRSAYKKISKKYGFDYATKLSINADKILTSEYISMDDISTLK